MENNNMRKAAEQGVFFLVIAAATFYLVFRSQRLDEILQAVSNVNLRDILIAIGCMVAFLSCEALNIRRSLRLFEYQIPFRRCIRYALVGFFFSSVTPSASGGQPMQLYFMQKDRVQLSHGTLSLLMEMASFQTVTVSMALIGLVTQSHRLGQIGAMQYVLLAGVIINMVVLGILLTAIFSKNMIQKLIRIGLILIKPFCGDRLAKIKENLQDQVTVYQESAVYIRKNKRLMMSILLTTVVQIVAFHSIPFWIYRSFGLSGYSFWTVVALQSILFIAVSALPLPGAMGASEGGFLLLFQALFPASLLSSAMLLNRGVSFYLFVVVSGISVLMFVLIRRKGKVSWNTQF